MTTKTQMRVGPVSMESYDDAYGKRAVKRAARFKRKALREGLKLENVPRHVMEKANVRRVPWAK